MKRFLALLAVAVWAATGVTPAEAQSGKVTIEVLHTGEDSVGCQLATAVREEVAKSARFSLVADGSATVDILMVSMDMDKTASGSPKGNRSAISVLYELWIPSDADKHKLVNVRNVLHTLGVERVEQGSRDVMAGLDAWLQELAKEYMKK